ncbi:NUDIX domain-containing protein [Streptomyces spirodelae]|uniref:NUDIX domain-containing protein n=1 Tax=Streptomyces spirodelae TaxID=2812904 RepID=UPI0027DB01E6|nr:NUDIX domain-containing protein [Streptomyces spirodelae]
MRAHAARSSGKTLSHSSSRLIHTASWPRRRCRRHHGPPPPRRSWLPRQRGERGAPEGTELYIVGVHLYLQDEHGRILLGLRHPDSAYAPATWHFWAGHCEREAVVACLVREAKEEAGLLIDPGDVGFMHLVHLIDSPRALPRIQLVFRARSWSGTPEVNEPDRCVEWRWWQPQNLPAVVVPYTRTAIDGILARRPYSQVGWA